MEQVGPNAGNQFLLTVLQKADKQTVLYVSSHAEGRPALWKTVYEPFEQPKTEKIAGGDAGGFDFAEADGKYFVLARGIIS
jgi:tricorn protease